MFHGFPPETQQFFSELKTNNDRVWFAENKWRYEQFVMEPALEFVTEVQRRLGKIAPFFQAVPRRQGGSIMRIYRDVRFSKNKSPYKTNLGIHFRHELGKDAHAPGYYFHLEAGSAFMGCGIWHPESQPLNQIRALIDDDPQRWKRIKSAKKFKDTFRLDGRSLVRPPKGYSDDHPLIEDLKRKDHFVSAELPDSDIRSSDLVDCVLERMKIGKPYIRFICDALRIPS